MPPVTLPVDSPWALPPMIVLQSRTGGRASPALRRRVLHLRHLALSPAARRSVRAAPSRPARSGCWRRSRARAGPLLVLALDGRHIRAQETTLWMTRTALRDIPAMPAKLRPRRLLLEPVATDRIDLAGPPPAKPGNCARSSTSTAARATGTASTGACWPRSTAWRRTSARTRTSRAPARSAGCSSCPRPGGAGASTRPATASPIPTTRRTRSSARRATSTPRGARRTSAARSSPTTTPTGTSTRFSRSRPRSPPTTALS